MKYAKKMKLIEIDGSSSSSYSNNDTIHLDDQNYSKARVLSTLDNSMNEILKSQTTSDADKWFLYSQVLHKYLNHIKYITQKPNHSSPIPENANNNTKSTEESFNLSSLPDMDVELNTTNISQARDSLDSINIPAVRSFFEKARNTDSVPALSQSSSSSSSNVNEEIRRKPKNQKKPRKNVRALPYTTRSTAKKRGAERNLSADLSHIRPTKVAIRRWESSNAR